MQKFHKIKIYLLPLIILSGCAQVLNFQQGSEQEQNKPTQTDEDAMHVYKNSFCFCCKRWMRYLEKNNIKIKNDNSQKVAEVKKKWGIPYSMQGCHTGVFANKYVFEGHVPARLVHQFLSNPPANSIGLAVPGMPALSPGMYKEGKPQHSQAMPYHVYLILADGQYRIYETVYRPE